MKRTLPLTLLVALVGCEAAPDVPPEKAANKTERRSIEKTAQAPKSRVRPPVSPDQVVRLEEPLNVAGAYEPEYLLKALSGQMSVLGGCHTASKGPNYHGGRIVLGVVIDERGFTVDMTIKEDETGSKMLGSCISKRALRWSLQAPEDPIITTFDLPVFFPDPHGNHDDETSQGAASSPGTSAQ